MVTKSGGFAWEVLHFCLDPRLDPLGSTWIHVAQNVLFAAFGLGSALGSTWIHLDPCGAECTICNIWAWLRAWIHLVLFGDENGASQNCISGGT